jgi:glucose-6-phosphate dehydrogenase assembly protein OpcA
MSEDVWSASDTTPDAIEAALRELLRERHAANESLAPARVLNLIVIVDRSWKGEISNRLERVGRYHASRTVLCAVEEGRTTLDAFASIGYDENAAGAISAMWERVEVDMGPEHLGALDTIVDPIVISNLQTMLWCPHGHREAVDALRNMVDVMLLDSDDDADASTGLRDAAELLQSAYVVDLAWLRTTPWRERLASSFDPADRVCMLAGLEGVTIRHRQESKASALLLAGWLCSRLGWQPGALSARNGSGMEGTIHADGREIELALEPRDQEVPGLAGVTVAGAGGFSLSLDRGPGGLRAHENSLDGVERDWQVLGASRGEGGILGEGVRQALLRDPTYSPALDAAQELCG